MILKPDLASFLVTLNGIPIPGILQSMSINGEVLIDSNNDSGQGKTAKVSRGLRDKRIQMDFLLVDSLIDPAYVQLLRLEKMFHQANKGIPQVFVVAHEHLLARGIKKMLFRSFSSSERSGREISVALSFEEFTGAGYENPKS